MSEGALGRCCGFLLGRWRCFGHALRGLCFLVRTEANAVVHLAASLAVALAAAAFRISAAEWRWLVAAIALVWCAEAFNTAMERVCDLIQPLPDPRVKAVKDVAAGAVLCAAVAAGTIGLITFWPYVPPLWGVAPR